MYIRKLIATRSAVMSRPIFLNVTTTGVFIPIEPVTTVVTNNAPPSSPATASAPPFGDAEVAAAAEKMSAAPFPRARSVTPTAS